MKRPVVLLLSILLIHGKGCPNKDRVQNLLDFINTEKQSGFRKAFPKDYKISHHYNDELLCENDQCCVFWSAATLADAWSQLLFQLWRINEMYSGIEEMKMSLDTISKQMSHSALDLSSLHWVSSSPEELLDKTEAVFKEWQRLCALTDTLPCEFPTTHRREPNSKVTEDEQKSTVASLASRSERYVSIQASLTGGTASTRFSLAALLAAFFIFCLTDCYMGQQ